MPVVALVVDDSMLIRHTVCRFLEERGFEFVDLDKRLATIDDVSPFFYIVNDHLTKEGHALLADELTSRLLGGHQSTQDCSGGRSG